MKQKLIIPLTKKDFETLEIMILKNNDKFCLYCDGELETNNRIPFSAGIFYICKQCGKKFKKTKHLDMSDKNNNYFELKEIRG